MRTPFLLESILSIHIEKSLDQVGLIFDLAEYCLVFAMEQALTYGMAEADSQGTSSLRVLSPFWAQDKWPQCLQSYMFFFVGFSRFRVNADHVSTKDY